MIDKRYAKLQENLFSNNEIKSFFFFFFFFFLPSTFSQTTIHDFHALTLPRKLFEN